MIFPFMTVSPVQAKCSRRYQYAEFVGNAAKAFVAPSSRRRHFPGRSAIVKICLSFVSETQISRDIAGCRSMEGLRIMLKHLPDHGLPLVQLKEQRRDLVVALQNRNGLVNAWELMQIAAVQQAISAFEDVITDLDAEMEAAA
jgi:hypothetical protein